MARNEDGLSPRDYGQWSVRTPANRDKKLEEVFLLNIMTLTAYNSM